ncbi:hypothetical protein ASC87_21475 [Rhizobacter sp. Root1221]|nr:hypothetical protein ASC87_21475 [Rhizobacter sp. Root1221]
MEPPSATDAVDALSDTVAVEPLSVTVVLTLVNEVPTDSKLPPVAAATPTTSGWSPCTYGSSPRTANGALLPVLWPTGMVMVWPLDSVSTTGEPATGLDNVAV